MVEGGGRVPGRRWCRVVRVCGDGGDGGVVWRGCVVMVVMVIMKGSWEEELGLRW